MATTAATNETAGDAEDVHSRETEGLLEQESAPAATQSTQMRVLIYALPALLLCQFVVSFDSAYIIGNFARRIAVELKEFRNASWVILGDIVTEGAFLAMYGHAAEVYGHRRAILFAAAATCLGYMFSSLSHRLWQIALARVFVGMGTAGIDLLVVVIINDFVQLSELPLWMSAATVASTAGFMLGGPVGAAVTDRLGFRPFFAFELCAMVVVSLVLWYTLRLPDKSAQESPSAAHKLEYLSAVLFFCSVAAPLFALNLGGEVFAWSSPAVITLFCLTPLCMGLCYYAETRVADTPIVPRRFITNKNIAVALACVLPLRFGYDQLQYSFGIYVEARSFINGSKFSDWALTCVYLGRPIGSILCGIAMKRYRIFKLLLQLNILAEVAIYACFASGIIHPEQPVFVPFLLAVGATAGFGDGLALVAVLSLVQVEDQALLYAFLALLQSLFGDLGIAISLAAESNMVRSNLYSKLGNYPNADEIIRKSLEDLAYIRQLPLGVQSMILNALISSTEKAFGISGAVFLISVGCSFFLKEMSSDSGGLSYVA